MPQKYSLFVTVLFKIKETSGKVINNYNKTVKAEKIKSTLGVLVNTWTICTLCDDFANQTFRNSRAVRFSQYKLPRHVPQRTALFTPRLLTTRSGWKEDECLSLNCNEFVRLESGRLLPARRISTSTFIYICNKFRSEPMQVSSVIQVIQEIDFITGVKANASIVVHGWWTRKVVPTERRRLHTSSCVFFMWRQMFVYAKQTIKNKMRRAYANNWLLNARMRECAHPKNALWDLNGERDSAKMDDCADWK